MTRGFPYYGEDFCMIHGRDHMRYAMGNPIPWCQACEDEAETAEPRTPIHAPIASGNTNV